MEKLVKDWTLDDYKTYCNLRTCDGNWTMEMALIGADFLTELPKKKLFESKKKYKAKCEKIFKDNLHLLWNLEAYPNLAIDIDTGEVSLGEDKRE